MFDEDVVIVDGSYILHRVFHATKPYIENGFRIALGKLKRIKDTHPDCVFLIVFDNGGCDYRKSIHPNYKANRPDLPEIFYTYQRNIIDKVMDIYDGVFSSKGIEGDDIIASLKEKYKGKQIYIYTRDKDIFQLIDDTTSIVDPFELMLFDTQGCLLKHGVLPEKVWLKLVLKGDSADGIDGIPGIGENTAKQLANKYNSIEELLLAMPMYNSYKETLVLNEKLVRLRNNVI